MVASEDAAFGIYDIAFAKGFRRVVLEKFDVGCLTGQKADVLGLGFVVGGESFFFGNPAGVFLEGAAERENDVRELVLREVVHHVRLVFTHVDAFMDFVFLPLWVEEDPRIVAGRKVRRDEVFPDFVIEKAEFHFEIAHHTGIRRHAFGVGIDEVPEDEFLVSLSDVYDLKGDADEISHGSRAFDLLLLPIELVHGRSADFVARFQKELCGECAVDTAGHGDDDFFLFCHKNRYPFCGKSSDCQRWKEYPFLSGPYHSHNHHSGVSPENLIGVKVRRIVLL